VHGPYESDENRDEKNDAEDCAETSKHRGRYLVPKQPICHGRPAARPEHITGPAPPAAANMGAMKAVLIREHGGYDRLEMTDLPEPEQGAEALVRVRAVALNHLDIWLRRGVPGHRFPLPMIPGSEASGVILSVPESSEGWKEGDEVIVAPGYSCGHCIACLSGEDPLCRDYGIFGESKSGGATEIMAVPLRNLVRKPPHLSFEEAAAIPLDFLTAWHMLVPRAQLRPGETVLIHAGGSGVGSAGIQVAKLWGATVFTTVGSEKKGNLARELGADEVILYRETDFAQEIRKLTGKRGVDVVFEHVGADTFDGSMRSLARGGRLVTCGATTGAEVAINLRLVFFKLLSILGSTMGSLAELHQIMKHVESGRFRPVIDRVLPLDQVAEGHRLLEEREAFGKIVLKI
jgi:NADPH:quinone reductase-like Zn-dependent oxidoreductase